MKLSHSRTDCFAKCPRKYKYQYLDRLKVLPDGDPQNALILGDALHKGIEKDVGDTIKLYFSSFPIITNKHIEEAMKLEYWIPQIKAMIPPGGLHEVEIEDDNFIGFIDYLVPVTENSFDLYDWKYSNNIDRYLESGQLHEYKYFFEKTNPGKRIRNMYFVFIPKIAIRMKRKNKTNPRDETVSEFRKRIRRELAKKEIQFIKVDYVPDKVIDFMSSSIEMLTATKYPKNETRLCDWCDFRKLCQRKDDVEMLPSTQRRKIEKNTYKKVWFYGLPFSGKTYLANQFDTPLMLNTDGNIKQVDAPFISIKDEVTVDGRITKRKFAWEVFTEAIDDLEKGSDFKTIVIDLLEDVYDACRVKVCHDNGWDHESDDSFKAYDIVRSEFIRTMKRLLNLDYNIVLISHEDASRDLTKKTGDKVTAIKPNLQEKIALKICGMVDIACRIINDDGKRTISFKSNPVEFGGGRLEIGVSEIPCEYAELIKIYGQDPPAPAPEKVDDAPKEEPVEVEEPAEEQPKRRTRKTREENN